jgi:ribosomal protein S18 acetylase RimI-like enzyme
MLSSKAVTDVVDSTAQRIISQEFLHLGFSFDIMELTYKSCKRTLNMSLKVAIVNYKDIQQSQDLVFLLDSYAKDPMGGAEGLSDYSKANLITELSKRSTAFSVIAYADNKPAGLINCFFGFSTFKCKPLVYIHDVVVLPEFRGQKISLKMLEYVEVYAKENDCCKMTLEVLEGNKVAKSAYLKFGFKGYELDPELGKALFWEKVI